MWNNMVALSSEVSKAGRCKGRAATVETKQLGVDVCQGVSILNAQYGQHGGRGQVALLDERDEIVDAKVNAMVATEVNKEAGPKFVNALTMVEDEVERYGKCNPNPNLRIR
ncbi:hypothetical protein HAX54_048762 [Datura stramonium]|uniref:Uncharacterized protein n=1 Tax=Datura stramonium TaxID=4076 RepID=A0ABS8WJM3_DATST|nr:hypothetical protein [Datura stramonium]